MSRSAHFLVPLTILALGLTACGGSTASDDTSEPAGDTKTTAAADTGGEEPAGDSKTTAAADTGSESCADAEIAQLISEVEGLSAEEREEVLVEKAAEAGGQISLYTEMSDWQPVADRFEERFDDAGLELNVYRAGSDSVRQRILEESAAGFAGADLLEIEAIEMVILDNEGVLAPSSSPWADEVVEAGQYENFTADRFSYIMPLWNATVVDGPPASLDGFASEEYAGVLALEDSDVYWFAVLVEHFMAEEGMSKDEAIQVFKDIAANASISHGHTTTAELIVAGQYGITPNAYLHRATQFVEDGAPVEWQPVNVPVVAEITAVSAMCSAPNPAGALLLEDFFLAPDDVQAVLASVGRTPANREAQAAQLGGVEIEPIRGDVAEVVADYSEWSDLWDQVIRSGQ